MRQIINQTTTRVYMNGRLYDKTDTDTIEIPDPIPTPSPVRTLRTNAPACAHCHQAPTACRCRTTQPRTQAQDAEDWMPRTIMLPQGKDTPPVTMSAETRAIKAAYDQHDTVFYKCLSHPNMLDTRANLTACSTQQLLAIHSRLERGEIVKDVLDDHQKAWSLKSILGIRRP